MAASARGRLSMATLLAAVFGGGLALALALMLALIFYAGTRNTRELVAERANLTLDLLELRVESYLEPVAAALGWIPGAIASNELDPEDDARMGALLGDVLATTPSLSGIALVRPDLMALRTISREHRPVRESWSGRADIEAALATAPSEGVQWGAPLWSPTAAGTIINARMALRRDGELVGLLVAAITLERFTNHVRRLGEDIGYTVFVLYGPEHVIAHSSYPIIGDSTKPNDPLPSLASFADPVLRELATGRGRTLEWLGHLLRGEGRAVDTATGDFVVIWREVPGFSDLPWRVGLYLEEEIAEIEIKRLLRAGYAGLGLIALAILVAVILGNRLARPLRRLATRASAIRTLSFATGTAAPPGPVREIAEANRAFDAMERALDRFMAYVPRRLVRDLVEIGEIAPRTTEVTVMFTDLAGFSALAERLDATATAALLNRHFALLAEHIAASGGTIDKYIGDGAMAFWGAPVAQPDHAARAIAAARGIAAAVAADRTEPRLRVRIGLHTGPVLAGEIGAADRLNYTLVGDSVNIAQRLEQLGKEVDPTAAAIVLASDATIAAAGAESAAEPVGSRQLKGRDRPVVIFRLRDAS